ncbi:MAG: oxygen-independent coproporphyrinogen III oxidase [Opitutales bacterium]
MDLRTSPSINLDLVRKYNRPGPRYTSYPPATKFREDVDREALRASLRMGEGPLSLYVHLPFCESLCWFCGCNTIITRNRDQAGEYLALVEQEIERVAAENQPSRPVVQLHFGGGTPNFLTPEQIQHLGAVLRQHFRFAPDLEASVELDPRTLRPDHVEAFAAIGFNRASFGVQDIHADVQQAIHRRQDPSLNRAAMQQLRTHGFQSVNIDLIYGLPHQTPQSFTETLAAVTALKPDRLAVFSYAHVPWIKPAQKLLERAGLPDAETKLELLRTIYGHLTACGYVPVGMDHFARADDELVRAQQAGTLQRNFQGYSTRGGADICAFGISAISQTAGTYWQNCKNLTDYRLQIESGQLPIERGLVLTEDDSLRRWVITTLMCQLELDPKAVEERFHVDFFTYFSNELDRLKSLEADGLLCWQHGRLRVRPAGRLLIRNIAMAFDAYLPNEATTAPRYSRTI